MASLPGHLDRGSAFPLGATWDGLGTNFAVFSAHAERIQLCLFDPTGRHQMARYDLPECTDDVWHGYLPDAQPGLIYGYRAYGPYRPQDGHRFNPSKLLLDPYARGIAGSLRWSDALFGYRISSPRADLSLDRRDSAPTMLKAVVSNEAYDWGDDRPPHVPWSNTLIYEMHVRGFTMLHEKIAAGARGTFSALGDARVIQYLQKLGVTAVELLPIHAAVQDRTLVERGLKNYWGYNSIGFFAIEPRYLSDPSGNEMRAAVRRLHAAGIEVILDVVYNHTAEGSELGPTLSFRGLDNASYYRLSPDHPRYCVNYTGCGNTLNLSHPRVLQMVMDSLRYWVSSYHVDGFRFDLGVTMGRTASGFDTGSAFFQTLQQDPILAQIKLISEPWDLGPNGYQVGRHPGSFAEWNDRFRDSTRRFWRGDAGERPEFAARLVGSADMFQRPGRRPWASINFAACHDGFTLRDVVSFTARRNQANGEHNKDGLAENYSSNWGVEGETTDQAILAIRARICRAMLATVMFAHGTPMLLAGDEFGRSQNGNNNAYCQDNETSWLDWAMAQTDEGVELIEFVRKLVALRRDYPVLASRQRGQNHELARGVFDIAWFDQSGDPISEQSWKDPQRRQLTLRRACKTPDGAITLLTLLLNPGASDEVFALPAPATPGRMVLDTARPSEPPHDLNEQKVEVQSHSAVLVYAQQEHGL